MDCRLDAPVTLAESSELFADFRFFGELASMVGPIADRTQGNEVVFSIVTQLTSFCHAMDLLVLRRTAVLTPISISPKYLPT
jgi:hypothetical protein